LVVDETDGQVTAEVRAVRDEELPEGDVTVAVEYSCVNYKDAMIIGGLGGMVRRYPHVPGVDFVGRVKTSTDPAVPEGDAVILTGYRVGESRWGGYAQRARVEGAWLVPLPGLLSARRAMALGTAGLTAMLSVTALRDHGLAPDGPPVLITGATGGVGSLSIMLLHRLGYTVHASTGKADAREYLRSLGADDVVDRSALSDAPVKALQQQTWAGCIDSVGGDTLAQVLSRTIERGTVVSVGLTGGEGLATSLTPFLLRGVNLLGVASASCPSERRLRAWEELTSLVPGDQLDAITQTVGLEELPALAQRFLRGEVRGRTVVDVNA
jgi:acrylyl-CoA reductase (NADPH)